MIFGKSNIACEVINTPLVEGNLETVGIKIGNTVIIIYNYIDHQVVTEKFFSRNLIYSLTNKEEMKFY
jgi:hypothetical protein